MGRKKKRRVQFTPKAKMASLSVSDFRRASEGAGFFFRESIISGGRGGRRLVQHWQLSDTVGRVIDFWPTTMRWRSPRTSEGGVVKDCFEVIEVARKIASVVGPCNREVWRGAVNQEAGRGHDGDL